MGLQASWRCSWPSSRLNALALGLARNNVRMSASPPLNCIRRAPSRLWYAITTRQDLCAFSTRYVLRRLSRSMRNARTVSRGRHWAQCQIFTVFLTVMECWGQIREGKKRRAKTPGGKHVSMAPHVLTRFGLLIFDSLQSGAIKRVKPKKGHNGRTAGAMCKTDGLQRAQFIGLPGVALICLLFIHALITKCARAMLTNSDQR